MTPHFVKDFRPDVNGLRAIAVGAVVLYHFGFRGLSGGFVGVDVFFVISGYLMIRILAGGAGDSGLSGVWSFYAARARRIVPALFVMAIAVLAIGWLLLEPAEYARLARHARDSLLFTSNLTYTREAGYFDTASNTKWFLHTWSLSVEWQFYLILPWLFVGFRKAGFGRKARLGWLCILAFLFFLNCGLATPTNPTKYFFALKGRAWELLVGGIVFFLSAVPLPRGIRLSLNLGGLGLILFSACFIDASVTWPGWWAAVPVAGAACIILSARQNAAWSSNAIMQWVGYRSYSIYLWHWPIVVFLAMSGRSASLPHVLAGLVTTLILADLSYRFVEEPGRRLFGGTSPRFWAGLALWAIVGVGVPVGLIASGGGYQRFGEDADLLRKLEAARDDWVFDAVGADRKPVTADVPPTEATGDVVVVMGDSHAEQWYARVASLPRRPARVLFITQSGCLPIPGHERAQNPQKCADFARDAWREVLALRPSRLILVAAWQPYFVASDGRYVNDSCIASESGCRKLESEADLDFLMAALRERTASARKEGIAVAVVGPIPQADADYANEKANSIIARHLPLRAMTISQSQVLSGWLDESAVRAWARPVTQRLEAIARDTGSPYFDPVEQMCASRRCPLMDADGTPLYKDASHLRPGTVRGDRFRWFDRALFGSGAE